MAALIVEPVVPLFDTRTVTAPLPTDSMVTVRLSDVQIYSEVGVADQSPRGRSASESSHTTGHSSSASEESMSPTASVDWAELEKTEKQEPKSEGADEVWQSIPWRRSVIDMSSQPPCFSLVWSRKTLPLLGTPSLVSRNPPDLAVALVLRPCNI